MEHLHNTINGDMVAPRNGRYLDNVEPATGQVYSRVPDSDAADVDAAVAAARAAFPGWSGAPPAERHRVMMAVAAGIRDRLDELSHLEAVDSGKPLRLARQVEIPRAASNFEHFAAAALTFASESHPMGEGIFNYTRRDPIGVVGCISPWNLPLYLFTWKIAPALAVGNTVVAKPSELTPATATRLAEICVAAGMPPGVLNIVHGRGASAGSAIVEHPGIPCISFTGGTATGAAIARSAAPRFKKLSLELGGKNPTIVFADCDYDRTVGEVARAAFANQGQICLCGSRILVERSIYDRFRDDLVARATAMRVGDPLEADTLQGALVSESHFQKVLSYLDLAREEGGTVLCGGEAVTVPGRCAGGWFIAPTLIEGLDAACRTNREEIFGPVATLIPFDGEVQALELANGVDYGLSASIWTADLARAHRVAHRVQAGVVWINCWLVRDLRTPFGGMKQSGVGREGGMEAMRFFTEAKNVCVQV